MFGRKRCAAVGLIEISWVLIIMGILMGAVMKGHELLTKARLYDLSQKILTYKKAVDEFVQEHSCYPHEYGTEPNLKHFFPTLQRVGLLKSIPLTSEGSVTTTFGAKIQVSEENGELFFRITRNNKGFLTPKQASTLKHYVAQDDDIKFTDAEGGNTCYDEESQSFTFKTKSTCCIVHVAL